MFPFIQKEKRKSGLSCPHCNSNTFEDIPFEQISNKKFDGECNDYLDDERKFNPNNWVIRREIYFDCKDIPLSERFSTASIYKRRCPVCSKDFFYTCIKQDDNSYEFYSFKTLLSTEAFIKMYLNSFVRDNMKSIEITYF